MLEVIAPPAADLVSLETAKAHLGVEGTADDAVISALISRASASISSYLSFNPNVASYRQTEETGVGQSYIIMTRVPVVEVTAVEVDGAELTTDAYRLDSASGLLARLSSGRSRCWESRSVVVITYHAGYETTPADIQSAALKLIESDWAARGRDPGLKSIGIGSINLNYFTSDAVPSIASVAPLLDPYRFTSVG